MESVKPYWCSTMKRLFSFFITYLFLNQSLSSHYQCLCGLPRSGFLTNHYNDCTFNWRRAISVGCFALKWYAIHRETNTYSCRCSLRSSSSRSALKFYCASKYRTGIVSDSDIFSSCDLYKFLYKTSEVCKTARNLTECDFKLEVKNLEKIRWCIGTHVTPTYFLATSSSL